MVTESKTYCDHCGIEITRDNQTQGRLREIVIIIKTVGISDENKKFECDLCDKCEGEFESHIKKFLKSWS
jgi:hypothetical protein